MSRQNPMSGFPPRFNDIPSPVGATEIERPPGSVISSLKEVQQQVDSLEDKIQSLHYRLQPVLREIDNQPNPPSAPKPLFCPLASELVAISERISIAVEALARLETRLEL